MGDNYVSEGQHLIRALPLFHRCISRAVLSGCKIYLPVFLHPPLYIVTYGKLINLFTLRHIMSAH